jgi:hypothetical protein
LLKLVTVIGCVKYSSNQLKGAARRRFQAQTTIGLGYGGQLLAQKELGWDRNTIRKGIKELTTGITCVDNYSAKGRYKAEEHLLFTGLGLAAHRQQC